MSVVKPPGSSGIPTTLPEAGTVTSPTGTQGTTFSEHVEAAQSASHAKDVATPVTRETVLGDLRAGRIDANTAVHRLTELSLDGAGLQGPARVAVAEKIRGLLANDPTLRSLLQRAGAAVPPTEE